MISSVYQSLQSHVLSFHLFPQEPSYYSSRFSPEVGENEEDNMYVHPLIKKSCTRLSKKSLDMCTERLGSESGSDMGETEADECWANVRCSTWMQKKANPKSSYPPPLTSISGVRMESYREDGRLVLRAVACCASRSSYFHAERSQGRLKLQLVKVKDRARQRQNGEQVEDQEQGGEEVLEEEEEEENDGEGFGKRQRSCCSSSTTCKQERQQSKELLNWNPRWVST